MVRNAPLGWLLPLAPALLGLVLSALAPRAAGAEPVLPGSWLVHGQDSVRGDFSGELEIEASGRGGFAVTGVRRYAGRPEVKVTGTARLTAKELILDLTLAGPGMLQQLEPAGGQAAQGEEKIQGTYVPGPGGNWRGTWRTLGGRPAAGPETLTRPPPRAAEVEVLDLVDCDGNSVLDRPVDLRAAAESADGLRKAAVRYRVKNGPARVTIRIEYAEGERANARFYKKLLPAPPTVVILLRGEEKIPGEYQVAWDGRDATSARRLLLGGLFHVVASVDAARPTDPAAPATTRAPESRKAFRVAPPAALCVGPRFPPGFLGEAEDDCRPEVQPAQERLSKLKDGSGFRSVREPAATATGVLDQLRRRLSVFVYSGHGGAGKLWFYDNASDAKADDAHASVLTTAALGDQGRSAAAVLPKDGKPFKDVFLVVAGSCLNDGASTDLDLPAELTRLGADVVIAFRHSTYSGLAVPFVRGLFARLRAGQDVEVAARSAAQGADRSWTLGFDGEQDSLESAVVIQKAPNLPTPLTLTPARYGDSQN
ncbi:MAG: hypothetical protein HYZ53_07955 [Planctomycetes bacterium]|nr:hypothetical protein [Planctomycetota bacterium]